MANLIRPNVPDASLTQNTVISLGVCGLGVVALLVAIASLRVPRVHSTALRLLRVGQHLGFRASDGRKIEAGDKLTGVVRLSWHGGDRRASPAGERGGNHGTRAVSLG